MGDYLISQENFGKTYEEFLPLYVRHYSEMADRMKSVGICVSPYNPRVDIYLDAAARGDLLHYTVREHEIPVGYANIFLTNDMHNHDLIAREDTLFIHPLHRNGVGRRLSLFVLDDLRKREVKRLSVTALTDLRVAKLWKRMGFKHTAHHMTFDFEAE